MPCPDTIARPRAGLLLMMLLTCVSLMCAAPTKAQDATGALRASSILDLAADGRVEAVEVHASHLLPHVVEAVEKSIGQMRFDPVVIEGVPRRVRTSAEFRINFVGEGDARRLMVALAAFGLPVATVSTIPPFPEAALQRGHGAELWMLAEVDASGTVLRAAPLAVILSALPRATGDDRERQQSADSFVAIAQATLSQWKIQMVEADSDGVKRLIVPFAFTLAEEGGTGREFPPRTFPALELIPGGLPALRARTRAVPAGALLQLGN